MIAVGRSSYHILLYIITPCRFFVLSSVLRCVAHYFFFVTYETLLTFNITAEVSGRSGGDIDDRDGLNAGGESEMGLDLLVETESESGATILISHTLRYVNLQLKINKKK